jgi:hypothetical protein
MVISNSHTPEVAGRVAVSRGSDWKIQLDQPKALPRRFCESTRLAQGVFLILVARAPATV